MKHLCILLSAAGKGFSEEVVARITKLVLERIPPMKQPLKAGKYE